MWVCIFAGFSFWTNILIGMIGKRNMQMAIERILKWAINHSSLYAFFISRQIIFKSAISLHNTENEEVFVCTKKNKKLINSINGRLCYFFFLFFWLFHWLSVFFCFYFFCRFFFHLFIGIYKLCVICINCIRCAYCAFARKFHCLKCLQLSTSHRIDDAFFSLSLVFRFVFVCECVCSVHVWQFLLNIIKRLLVDFFFALHRLFFYSSSFWLDENMNIHLKRGAIM